MGVLGVAQMMETVPLILRVKYNMHSCSFAQHSTMGEVVIWRNLSATLFFYQFAHLDRDVYGTVRACQCLLIHCWHLSLSHHVCTVAVLRGKAVSYFIYF